MGIRAQSPLARSPCYLPLSTPLCPSSICTLICPRMQRQCRWSVSEPGFLSAARLFHPIHLFHHQENPERGLLPPLHYPAPPPVFAGVSPVLSFLSHLGISVQWIVGDNRVTRIHRDCARAGVCRQTDTCCCRGYGTFSGHETTLSNPCHSVPATANLGLTRAIGSCEEPPYSSVTVLGHTGSQVIGGA